MSSIDKLKEEEAKLQATLRESEERQAKLRESLEPMGREMDELRASFTKASNQMEADRIDARMYNLSRRMAPLEGQISEAEKAVRGARSALETVRKRLLQAETTGRGKWVVEYRSGQP